jgi:hypothetical protein
MGCVVALHHGLDQIAKLLSAEVVALNIRRHISIPVDNHCLKGMHQQGLIGKERHVEMATQVLDVRDRPD